MTDDATKMKQERDLALADNERNLNTLEANRLTIDRLTAECERFRADAERLDFVLANSAFIQTTASEGRPNTYQLLTQDEDENYIVLSGEGVWFPTHRAAIDAARGKP